MSLPILAILFLISICKLNHIHTKKICVIRLICESIWGFNLHHQITYKNKSEALLPHFQYYGNQRN
jgi:hypothetical protein